MHSGHMGLSMEAAAAEGEGTSTARPILAAPRWRIVIGDDHHLMAESLRSALADTQEVVALASTAGEILDAVRRHQPDLVLLDLSLPDRNGLELMPEILESSPSVRILVVTMHVDRALADACVHAGARGFVPKDAGLEELSHAIRLVMSGATFISRRVPTACNRVHLRATHAALSLLTPRQHEILGLVAEGRTSAEIGAELGLSDRTVSYHRTNIRAKLGVDSERGLIRYALLLRLQERDEGAPTA